MAASARFWQWFLLLFPQIVLFAFTLGRSPVDLVSPWIYTADGDGADDDGVVSLMQTSVQKTSELSGADEGDTVCSTASTRLTTAVVGAAGFGALRLGAGQFMILGL
ncbi:unnamed protein product [Prorocentrum cordatum]|uniref:Solute carrier family 40 protein n=1 Tax=Prorocentrum cordatum TaxID=2364126 RepID=A0ABN9VTV0_9DINO|nr:unnamed protein product [Polarella glacialis]|mmetsp:Transcript_58572/g.152243  ORF Transcript_58572/g.152243 Transcript_58572/m.152243 type:complete len:107 (-) Transcript_58572:67-387(-)